MTSAILGLCGALAIANLIGGVVHFAAGRNGAAHLVFGVLLIGIAATVLIQREEDE